VSRRNLFRVLFAVETVLLMLIVVVGIQVFVAQPYRIEHESMLDTLHDGEMVLVDKLTPRFTGYARGDIIVFDPPAHPEDPGMPYIKRVIGLPGDRIELLAGRVWVNGVALEETGYVYLDQPTEPVDATAAWVVGVDSLFVLGDHRADSTDSRTPWLGTVPVARVIGRAVARYWPPDTATLLGAPTYPELGAVAQAGPVTQVSMSRR
jgi:signal peptidase I